MRLPWAVPLCGLVCALLLAVGCAGPDSLTILGYTTRSQYPRDIQRIRVPIFTNKTFIRGLEFELTEALIKQIESKTPWKVVQENADVELCGTILAFPKRVVLQNQLNETRESEYTLTVQIQFRDLRTGLPLTSPNVPLPDEGVVPVPVPQEPQPNPLDPLAPLPPPPPPPLPPIIVQRNASFVQELGESNATARKRVVYDVAEQIVSMLEMPW